MTSLVIDKLIEERFRIPFLEVIEDTTCLNDLKSPASFEVPRGGNEMQMIFENYEPENADPSLCELGMPTSR